MGNRAICATVCWATLAGRADAAVAADTASSEEWEAVPNSYCSREGNSILLLEDESMGFGLTGKECRAACASNPECKVYTFGRWEKGLTSMFPGGHYGEMRCQWYKKCEVKQFKGMTVFLKPGAPQAVNQASQSFPYSLLVLAFTVLVGLAGIGAMRMQGRGQAPTKPEEVKEKEAKSEPETKKDKEEEGKDDEKISEAEEDKSSRGSKYIDLTKSRKSLKKEGDEEASKGPTASSKRLARAGFGARAREDAQEQEEDLVMHDVDLSAVGD